MKHALDQIQDMHTTALPDVETAVRDLTRRDFVRLWNTETIFEALSRLRSEEFGDGVIYFYVTDRDGKLIGVAPTRRLLLSASSTVIEDVMVSPVVSVKETEPLRDALEILSERQLLALPVVDGDDRLLGVLDAAELTRAAIDFERRESADELFQLIGVHMEQLRKWGALAVFANRFPWLLATIGGGIGAAFISRRFDHLLASAVTLAFFVPLVLSLSESVAMQSVTMSLDRLNLSKSGISRRELFRETRLGALLGIACGVVVGLISLLWLGNYPVALAVAGGILMAGAIGATFGFLVPRVVRRLRLNPIVASGPVALAMTDAAALACYFGFSSLLLT